MMVRLASSPDRGHRRSGWIGRAVATTALLVASAGGCGGRELSLRAQADAGSSGSSGGTGSTQAAAGSTSGTPSASVDATPPSRCAFAPDPGGVSSGPIASGAVVLSRIYQFLDDSSVVPSVAVPSQPTAAWAGDQAISILDGHVANGTEAPGLVRFLTAWLNLPAADAGLSAAHTWSVKLLDPSATLTTLLAGPTGDPHRIGILTDPQWLAGRPIISARGAWMSTNLWCVLIPPAPSGESVFPPPPPGQTRREELESALRDPSCAACHSLFDPAGYSMEHFDETGSYRDFDNGQPVDSSGTLVRPGPVSQWLKFTSIDDLAPQLAVSCPVAQCFAKAVMKDAFAVPRFSLDLPFTGEEVNHVANAFANSNFSIRELVKAIVATPSFLR